MATPCGLYREEAKSCINNTGICQALDANGNPSGQRLAVHPREAQASVPSQAQVMEQLKRMVSQEVRAVIGARNASTNATIIKDWRDQHVLTPQPNFDQELQLLGDETGWIEAGTISDVTLSLNSLIAGPSEGEDVELVGTQAKFTNMLETIKNPDTKIYPPNKQNTGFNKTGAVSLQSKLRCNPTDAHMNHSFQNRKPDSVIYKLNGGGAFDIEAIGDNKPSVKSDQSNFSDQEIAHILDMSQVLMTEIQPWRPFCISFLTDTRRFQFFKITRIKDSLSYIESRTFIGLTGWRIFLGLMMQPHHFFGYEEICIVDTVIEDILGIGAFGKYVFAGKYKMEEDRVIKLFPSAASRDKELYNLKRLNGLRSTAYATQIPSIIAEDIISSTGRHGFVLAPLCYPVQPWTGGCDVRGSDIAQLVDLLQAVHGLGLCHRDIKPSNILKRKDTGQIYLNDWGSTASSYIPVPWEGTVGFYDKIEGNHIPDPNEDLIALSRSAYLMLYNVNSSIPQDNNEIDLFWRNKMTGSSRLWDEITVRSQQGNYARLMEVFPLLK